MENATKMHALHPEDPKGAKAFERIQKLESDLAEKERQYAAMKEEYEAKFKAMKDAADAQHAEAEKLGQAAEAAALAGAQAADALEQAKNDFAAQLAAKDAELAEKDRMMTQMRCDFEAREAERDMQVANIREKLEAENAAEVAEHKAFIAELQARIAALEASAKTAEQIAAEKFGAGIDPIAGMPVSGKSLKERIEEARGNNAAMSEIARSHSRAEIIEAMKGRG